MNVASFIETLKRSNFLNHYSHPNPHFKLLQSVDLVFEDDNSR